MKREGSFNQCKTTQVLNQHKATHVPNKYNTKHVINQSMPWLLAYHMI